MTNKNTYQCINCNKTSEAKDLILFDPLMLSLGIKEKNGWAYCPHCKQAMFDITIQDKDTEIYKRFFNKKK